MPRPNPDAPFLIEDYIASKADFARPILTELHQHIATAHSELVEDWKWNGPAFTLGGKIICMLWGFKKHVSITFYRGSEIDDWAKVFGSDKRTQHTRRLTFKAGDQPDAKIVVNYLQQACALEETDLGRDKNTPKKKRAPIRVVLPDIFKQALAGDPEAKAFFDQLAPSYRRDFGRWIGEAKREETRQRRLAKAMATLRAQKKSFM